MGENLFNLNKTYLFWLVAIFVFIFGFSTPLGSAAQISTVLIIVGCVLFSKDILKLDKTLFFLMFFLLYDLFICLLWPTLFSTYDYDIIPTKINFILSIFATYCLVFCVFRYIEERAFYKFLLIVFGIQLFFICLMLLNSDIANFILDNTKNQIVAERMQSDYSGARGLGIADSAAFGFSTTIGLFLFFTFYAFSQKHINTLLFLFLATIGVFAAISAGRVAIFGAAFGALYLFISISKIRNMVTLILMLLGAFVLIKFLISLRYVDFELKSLQVLYNYSMEPILNYIDYGEFRSRSTDGLVNMYFPLTESQFLIGDAKYSDGNSYYMATDAGYMRFILFYGGINSLIFYLSFLSFMLYFSFKLKNISQKILILFLAVMTFLLHYKGEMVFFMISYNKLMFLVIFYFYLRSKNIRTNNAS